MNMSAQQPRRATAQAASAARALRRWCRLGLLILILLPGRGFAADLQDMFANRESVTTETGLIAGDNFTATIESGEPRHGDRTGGASVWVSWIAPTNAIVTFTTVGSSFDTVLAAYYVEDGDPSIFSKLHRAAENDDDDSQGAGSTVVFGALAGKRYEIAVDGYRGARGTILLSWSIQSVGDTPPIVIATPNDQALREGSPLTLSVALQNPSAYSLHWFLNGRELEEEAATLYVPSLGRTNLGQYRLRLSLGEIRFFTKPVEIQINSEGLVDSLVRDKLYDALDPAIGANAVGGTTPMVKARPKASGPRTLDGVNRGYNGSQLFNTIGATAAPGEPTICGQAGAVTWFAYQPPENGTLMLNTAGSEIGVAITVFTYVEPLTSISQLEVITCDSPPANGTVSEVECAVLPGRTYVVGIAGLGDIRGVVKLNYLLDLTHLPLAPSVYFGGAELTVAAGQPLVLAAAAAGSPPLHFTWLKNGAAIPSDDAGALVLPSVAPTDAGSYRVRVRNHISEVLSGSLAVRVLIPPALQVEAKTGKVLLSFDTVPQQSYGLEYRDPSGSNVWLPLGPARLGTGSAITLTNDPPSSSDAWFRVRVQ